jgi:hypothetical protein
VFLGTLDVLEDGDACDVLTVESNDEVLLEAAVRLVRKGDLVFWDPLVTRGQRIGTGRTSLRFADVDSHLWW